ncbi:MAG TPA: DCC1-like thiol-disulfide oxidoreductase family protein, partial [Candidatus Binatia bacterium]|nr:DCC1-like thiol-disulfide oxidoreductase family protein [Candidatus Binatia bacterium]
MLKTKEVPDNLILFDGVCNLCSVLVQFVIHHDRVGKFRF